ncbi:hypothetical protein BDZ85DRAFT_295099 [Elsinoe ampelina]|uniref:AB hydrolase-1 domain-containing protein n=1 Tax=Elsinoe ampelina TaxID=302913 RepID=A0A6A6GE25_9PEZI|nr:hypothetical protein BDZ85DRAFT_295099 [Elsinoe ampelina]
MAATNNPMISGSMASVPNPNPVPSTTFHVAGILTTVYGLDLLPPPSQVSSVAILWLLHPRLQAQECMAPVAAAAIREWYSKGGDRKTGLIAVAFDQRNHGTRSADKLANEAWRQGNKRHALDMFSIYHGTARDVSILLDYIPAYIFPHVERTITQNLVLGISLGGHAAWHCLLQEPRITTAIAVIGCPDYTRLMTDRAAKSKLPAYVTSSPPGRGFIGSEDFPNSLMEQVEKYDPAGLLLGELDMVTGDDWKYEPSHTEKVRLQPILRDKLGGKKILCLSGGADKLVPYACGEPFLRWLENATKQGGWWSDGGFQLEDYVDPGAGHEYSAEMRKRAVAYICRALAEDDGIKSKM